MRFQAALLWSFIIAMPACGEHAAEGGVAVGAADTEGTCQAPRTLSLPVVEMKTVANGIATNCIAGSTTPTKGDVWRIHLDASTHVHIDGQPLQAGVFSTLVLSL